MNVELAGPEGRRMLYSKDKADAHICFAEIDWSPDSSVVGVVAMNCLDEVAFVGYDRIRQRVLTRSEVADMLRTKIKKSYPSSREFKGDILEWVKTPEAWDEFSNRVVRKLPKSKFRDYFIGVSSSKD